VTGQHLGPARHGGNADFIDISVRVAAGWAAYCRGSDATNWDVEMTHPDILAPAL
jgi:hypothetical protein